MQFFLKMLYGFGKMALFHSQQKRVRAVDTVFEAATEDERLVIKISEHKKSGIVWVGQFADLITDSRPDKFV